MNIVIKAVKAIDVSFYSLIFKILSYHLKNERNMTPLDIVSSRRAFKRQFNLRELYRALTDVPKAALTLAKNNKTELVNKNFIERLQLTVTEVNGCAACSYQHTKMALRQGMSSEEISSFLSGGDEFIRADEAKAILFAQHFADSKGFPKQYAYDAIVKEYGVEQASVILSAVQLILAGNMYGIPLSAFQSRCQGKTYKDSSFFYELGMLVGGIFCLPVALVHGIITGLIEPLSGRFDESPIEQ